MGDYRGFKKTKNMPIFGALGGIASSLLGNKSIANQNMLSRDFSRETYDKTYQGNLANWHRQNEYNDPGAQMQRLQNAGLNPAMMYGGSGGASSSGQSTSAAKTPETLIPNFQPMDFNSIPSNILSMADLKVKKAQTSVLIQDEIGKALKNLGTVSEPGQLERLRFYSFNAARHSYNQNIQDLEQSKIGHKSSMRSQDSQTKLKELEWSIRERGENPNDPTWQRKILKAIENPKWAKKSVKEILKLLFK